MGCDIHGWVERKVGDKYVAIKELEDRNRNYHRFAHLAGVRDYQDESEAKPKGVPNDVSDTAKYNIDRWDTDGHSHSYMPLSEAARIFLDTQYEPSDYQNKYPASAFFGIEEDDGDISEFRLVFWFDN